MLKTEDMNTSPTRWLARWLLLSALGAVAAAGLVFSQPSQASTAVLGLSPARWALLLALLGLAAGAAWLARREAWLARAAAWMLARPAWHNAWIGLAALGFVLALYLVLFSLRISDAFAQARLLRLLPLSVWACWACAAALLCWPRLRPASTGAQARGVLRPAALAGLVLLLAVGAVVLSGLGLQPDRTGWDTPGAPVLNTQVLLAWCAAWLIASLMGWAARRLNWRPTRVDLLAALGIWLLAAVLWSAQPPRTTHFSLAPAAPNWEYYPNSDAATLDIAAQRFLTGNGFSDVIEKPLYAFLLVVLHSLVGQEYAQVVNAQIWLLALFPVVLYFLAARLHQRFSGLLLALVIILRELNTLALSNRILVSHSKLLMTDLPTAVALAAFTLLVLDWLQHRAEQPRRALWVGAALGLLLLLRSQTLIFLPFLVLLVLLRAKGPWRVRLPLAGLVLLGFALTALPWMVRNAVRTGEFGYSQPFQALYMARQYSLAPESNDPGFDIATTPASDYVALGFANVRQFVLAHPGEVARFITAHFLHNEVASFLALPARFDLTARLVEFYNLQPYWPQRQAQLWAQCCSLDAYIASTPYWVTGQAAQGWDGQIPPDWVAPLALNVALVALGLGAAWRKLGWLSLVPVGMHLLYSASTALARVSGWRLILPADWVILLFYCLGIGQFSVWAARYLFGYSPPVAAPQPAATPATPGLRGLAAAAGLALLAGLFIPLAELAVPQRYAGWDEASALQQIQAAPQVAASGLDVAAFIAQPGAEVYWGRALYPRVYPGGENENEALDFLRVQFELVGPVGHMRSAIPGPVRALPNAADVVVLGCQQREYLHVVALVYLQAARPAILAPGAASLQCAALP